MRRAGSCGVGAGLAALALLLPLQALGQVVSYPRDVPTAELGAELGGVVLQNPRGAALPPRYVTFGTGFARGLLPAGSGLAALIGGRGVAVQLDVHSTWDDGSARWASVSVAQPELRANEAVPVTLTRSAAPTGAALAWPAPRLAVEGLGPGIDLGAALTGSRDVWLQGAIAVQRRADVPVPGDPDGALHVVADVTAYADGRVQADVQFRRDIATVQPAGRGRPSHPVLEPLRYAATIQMNGASQGLPAVTQFQYQDWHVLLDEPAVNVQHDVARLVAAGLVPPYDLAMGVSAQRGLYPEARRALADPGWGAPLAGNGVAPGMNGTGGRPDIGITTAANAAWLMTQDDTLRRYALGQADAGGAIPWHEWNAAAGRWWDPIDAPTLWTDARSGPASYSQYLSNAVPQQPAVPWDIAVTHMPNLDYVPALLTGSRYYRDMQAAQSMGSLVLDYVPNRDGPAGAHDVLLGGLEVRGIAWLVREMEETAALASPGSAGLGHARRILADSWAWWMLPAQEPAWAAQQGMLGVYVPDRSSEGAMSPWQQDYLISAVAMGARLGDAGAAAALRPIVQPRIASLLAQPGWNRRNGITYQWYVGSAKSTGSPQLTTWSALQQASVAHGQDNEGPPGHEWPHSVGDFASLARESLILYLHAAPDDANARAALAWLVRSGAPALDDAAYRETQQMEALALPPAGGAPGR